MINKSSQLKLSNDKNWLNIEIVNNPTNTQSRTLKEDISQLLRIFANEKKVKILNEEKKIPQLGDIRREREALKIMI